MSKHKHLTNKGYLLSKKVLTKEEIKLIKEELTVKPIVNKDYVDPKSAEVDSFKVYTEDKDYLYTPRYWGVKNQGQPVVENFSQSKINIKFKGKLRDKQVPVTDICHNLLLSTGGGFLVDNCGGGKTTMAVFLACKLGVKTMILVHKTFLQDQWCERIKQFSNAKIGIIRQNKVDVEGKDIVIAMLQSVCCRDYEKSVFSDIGLLIVDEAHHLGSRVYSTALQKIRPKYTLALSATPDRSDGMTKVIKWYLGDVMYKSKTKIDRNVVVKRFNYECTDPKFIEKKMWMNGKTVPAIPRMITNLCKIKIRNSFIINILNSLRKQYERKTLVLGARREHLQMLKEQLDVLLQKDVDAGLLEKGEVKTAFYMGQMKAYELVESAEADIIFGTYDMAKEGLDIDKLNTLVFASDLKDVVQSVGRILRKPIVEGDINPLIIDIIDDFSVFPRWAAVRNKFYNQSKYVVHDCLAVNDKCISVKEYLILKKVRTVDKLVGMTLQDVKKEYMCFKYGEEQYQFEQDLKEACEDGDGDDPEDEIRYNYSSDLNSLLKIDIEYIEDPTL